MEKAFPNSCEGPGMWLTTHLDPVLAPGFSSFPAGVNKTSLSKAMKFSKIRHVVSKEIISAKRTIHTLL